MYANTWQDGTPKSSGNAFSWFTPIDKAAQEKLERERALGRARYRKYKERDQAIVREQLKQKATRVNKTVNLGAHGGIANALKNR